MANRTAYNTLDLARLVLNDANYNDAYSGTQAAVIGYSQGGHSAVAVWLMHELQSSPGLDISLLYAGGAPHNLYRTVRGVLKHIDSSCSDAFCELVDTETTVPFATDRIFPALLAYSDTGLTDGQDYYYKVQAHNTLGYSTDSSVVSTTAGDIPDQVTGLSATAVVEYDADLAWTAPSANGYAITGYKIEDSSDNSNWNVVVADTGSTATTYTATYTNSESGNTKYWRVSAINGLGTGADSASANTKLGCLLYTSDAADE